MSDIIHAFGPNGELSRGAQAALAGLASKDYVDSKVVDSGTSGTEIQVGGTEPTSGWWLDNGAADTPVTANVPTADDTANTITWTPKTGVEYVIGGSVRTPPYSVFPYPPPSPELPKTSEDTT